MSTFVHMPYAKWNFRDWRTHTDGLNNDAYAIYHRLCMAMYEYGGPLPDDDTTMRHRLQQTKQRYTKVKAQLIALGHIEIEDGKIIQKRVIEELEAYATEIENRKKSQKNRRKLQKTRKKSQVSGEFSGEKPNENNGPPIQESGDIEREIEKDIDSTPLPPSRGAVPIGSASEMFPDPYANDVGVQFDNGCLTLANGTRKFWLGEFGNDERELNLALIEIAPKIRPSHPQPASAQAQSYLAERARTRRERQTRYEQRVAHGGPKSTARERQHDKVQAALDAMEQGNMAHA